MAEQEKSSESRGVTRRDFLKGVGAVGGAGMLPGLVPQSARAETEGDADLSTYPAGGQTVPLSVNGRRRDVHVKPSDTLLHVLREQLGLTGSKEVCDRGACGACTVLVDGRAVNSCMVLAIDIVGATITTVEGLAQGNQLDPVQQAFVNHDACQCGYCIPGFVMSAKALLSSPGRPSPAEIKQGLSGNICRCGAYPSILAAVQAAAGESGS